MIFFFARFVKLAPFIAILLIGCSLQLASEKKLFFEANSIRIGEIENLTKTPNVSFLLKQALRKKLVLYPFFTDSFADLELEVKITKANFLVEQKELQRGHFFKHSYNILAQVKIQDFRNLHPANTSKNFQVSEFIETRKEVLAGGSQEKIKQLAAEKLARKIFYFISE